MEQIELRKLQEDVDMLRRHAEGTLPIPAGLLESMAPLMQREESYTTPSSVARSKRTTEKLIEADAEESPATQLKLTEFPYHFKVEKPDFYDSQSYRRYKEYICRCEIAFQMQLDLYKTDRHKTLYASQYLNGETLDT